MEVLTKCNECVKEEGCKHKGYFLSYYAVCKDCKGISLSCNYFLPYDSKQSDTNNC